MRTDPPDLASLLGPWFRSPEEVAARFQGAGPLPHVVINNFLAAPVARALSDTFPEPTADMWHEYKNPLENKLACSDTARLPVAARDALFALCGPTMVETMRRITGLAPDEGLQADPYCHGGGLHAHTVGGKLDLHLDYSRHPLSGLERRFNLIVYLNERWDASYGGALELWAPSDANPLAPGALCAKVVPTYNRAILFDTAAPAFHGFPRPLSCPDNEQRRSLALYYLTPPRPHAPSRSKALYVPAPGDPADPALDALRAIRSVRRLEASDVAAHPPA